jgi:SAM-dependent methyltransferase
MSTPEFWDSRYAAAEYAYGTAPNAGLVALEHLLPRAARVLVPGDGEGRNGVWLATRGHRVTVVDQSVEGLRKCAQLAASKKVAVDTVQADLADYQPESAAFDALVLVFVHLSPEIRRPVHQRLLAALKPGGVLILEGFDRSHAGLPGGGPRDPAWLFDADSLRADFAACADLDVELIDGDLDEGRCHQGRARVLRIHGYRR